MAELPYSLDEAQRLKDKGYLDDDTFARIQEKLTPQGAAEEEAKLRTQLANPLFARAGEQPFSSEQLSAEAQARAAGSANSLVSQAAKREKADLLRAQEVERMGGAQAVAAAQEMKPLQVAYGPQPAGPAKPDEAAPVLTTDMRPQELAPQADPYAGLKDQLMMPFAMQQAGIAQGLKAAEAKAAEQSAFYNTLAKSDKERLDAQMAERQKQQVFLDEKLADLQKRSDEVAGLSVDPNRYWANKSTGDKILAGIGLFLGAFGQNGNQAAKIIQNAINTDIEAQKADIDQRSRGVQTAKSLYNEMVQVYRDKNAAQEATRVALLNNAQLQLQQLGAKYQGQEAKGKTMQLMGELEAQKQQAMMNFSGMMQKQYATSQLASGTASPEMLDDKQRERYVPGFGLALTKEDATKFKEYIGDYETAKTGILKLKSLADKPMKAVDRDVIAEADSLARMIQASLRTQVLGPGAVTDAERAMLEKIVANPTSIFSLDSSNKKRLDTLLSTLTDSRNAKARAFGITSPEEKLGVKTGFVGK